MARTHKQKIASYRNFTKCRLIGMQTTLSRIYFEANIDGEVEDRLFSFKESNLAAHIFNSINAIGCILKNWDETTKFKIKYGNTIEIFPDRDYGKPE